MKRRCNVEQCPVDDCAIIIAELDQAGLRDEPAKLDELPCPFTSFHNPGARVIANPGRP